MYIYAYEGGERLWNGCSHILNKALADKAVQRRDLNWSNPTELHMNLVFSAD